jgi:plasmid stabilization system protein ParE
VIRFRPKSARDMAKILAWYTHPGRKERFQATVLKQLAVIDASPLGFAVFKHPVRAATLRNFPQSLLYVIRKDGIVEIIAVFDGRRKPGSWR